MKTKGTMLEASVLFSRPVTTKLVLAGDSMTQDCYELDF